jgi:hypothetical protein
VRRPMSRYLPGRTPLNLRGRGAGPTCCVSRTLHQFRQTFRGPGISAPFEPQRVARGAGRRGHSRLQAAGTRGMQQPAPAIPRTGARYRKVRRSVSSATQMHREGMARGLAVCGLAVSVPAMERPAAATGRALRRATTTGALLPRAKRACRLYVCPPRRCRESAQIPRNGLTRFDRLRPEGSPTVASLNA